ncbi:MAG: acetyl-CoA C-acyltransferase, partial [Candidatus Binatus sp.]
MLAGSANMQHKSTFGRYPLDASVRPRRLKMREAVIVSTARTPIGKAYRGAFNDIESPSMAAPVIKEAVSRARLEPGEIDDVIMGAALQQGTQGFNVARQCVIAAGLPVSVAGQSVDRQCSSGLMSISMGAKQIVADGMQVVVAGGVESISLVQNAHMNAFHQADPIVLQRAPAIYMAMIDTAEVVSKRYKISREAQDEYSFKSQQRTFEAQEAGRFNDEIISTTVTKRFDDKKTGETTKQQVTLDRDECNRPGTTLGGLASLPPVKGPGGFITAGNASQLSDGASVCVLMERKQAEQRGLKPLGIYRGMAVAGCEPDEMGIG